MPRLSKVRIYSYVDFIGTFRKISILKRSKASGTLSSMSKRFLNISSSWDRTFVPKNPVCQTEAA